MKLNLKDIQKYLFPIKRIFSKYRQIRSLEQVKNFIQEQSAQVSQMTLYGYLKTRMGAKHVLMFEDKDFLNSINIAKWNVYAASLADCTFFCFFSRRNCTSAGTHKKAAVGLAPEISSTQIMSFLRFHEVSFRKDREPSRFFSAHRDGTGRSRLTSRNVPLTSRNVPLTSRRVRKRPLGFGISRSSTEAF